MIELAFTVCLIAASDTCTEKRLLFAETMTPMQCLTGAQVELAKWSEAHPKWRITRWKCGNASAITRDT